MKEALYYKKLENNKVQCELCPFKCIINNGETGNCNVRKNKDGVLISEIYNKISAISMDPIEKKPLYHFYPGSNILSIGTIGCNFHCKFCQNWEISQIYDRKLETISAKYLLNIAKEYNSIGIAYTYSEPSIWIETVLETAKIFRKENLKNVMVTNGFISEEPLSELVKYIDAMNIDVKAFNQTFYSKYCSGILEPVKKNVEYLYDKIHIELTMLIIEGLNDNFEEIENFVKWVADLDKNIPVHFSRYFPAYKMNLPPTNPDILYKIKQIAKTYLKNVYLGNI